MTDDRESLGRIVRETWVAWAREQYRPKPSWLLPWEDLDNGQREVDMRMGSAVAAQAVHDAGLEVAALEMARRKIGRIAALARDAKASAEPGMVPGVNADLLLALIGNEEDKDHHA